MSATERPNKMPQLEASASPELKLYWDLVRQLANAPEEVARAVVFLASPAASLITGANLVADAGFTKRVGY